ncbi:heavy-metal resistance protein [Breznakibacter xylanolyticus]|uniref:Heavy-metal resistance protein n=1 Tax=Breznakibacter xylanolyticus TaxID=990 RepID=A0A2W7N1K7_9BACT|nr:periplasmic heavy metal sensor [Breznakibacter xylanolyticus]PZX12247.1 heavy-metal resistance protein [Breznakibacter xylanolyticus]
MNESKKYRLIIVVLILLNAGLITLWWSMSNTGKTTQENNSGKNKMDFFTEALHLDSLQKASFDTLSQEHFERLGQLKAKIDSLKQVMRREIMQPEINESRLDSIFQNLAHYRTASDTANYRHFKRLRTLCTPSQQASFDSLVSSFMNRKDHKKDKPPHHR